MSREASPAPSGTSGNRRTRRASAREAGRPTIRVATFNINGFGNPEPGHPDNKWNNVYRMMRTNNIGILLVQEAHLNDERVRGIERMTSNKLKICISQHPERATQRDGVAVVLNKRLLQTNGAVTTEIVPGKAIQVSVPWNGAGTLRVLCVYAPSSDEASRTIFFEEVRTYYDAHPTLPKPQLMAGDFNNVEDVLDRVPARESVETSAEALDDLKNSLNLMLVDGWRATYPDKKQYTFQRAGSLSRLDRIYVTASIFSTARNWAIREADIPSDHSMVLVDLVHHAAPVMGKGRPVFPGHLLKDKTLAKQMKERGLQAESEMRRMAAEASRTEEVNPQTILSKMKRDWMQMARAREKQVVPKLLLEIQALEKEIRATSSRRGISDAERTAAVTALTSQVRQLKHKRVQQLKSKARARHRLEGERPTKYWTGIHREVKPRDVMHALEKEGEHMPDGSPQYEHDSVKMAELARKHHMDLQRDDERARRPEERETDIQTVLGSIDVKLSPEQATGMSGLVTYDECELALRFSKSASSPGLDGLTYEVWKTLHARYVEDSRHETRKALNVLYILCEAFNDVQIYGVAPTAGFNEGWMCPIYKEKGEKTRIVNYRPITLMNTDYKLLTKALSIRLAEAANDIIHPSQAGFVPGRRLRNHTQLARMMIDWAEITEANGAIVALDQEKAYDKIAHDYLWRTLETFGIPDDFIRTVKSLYTDARTSVMINGVLSKPYRVYRGVRQGDPMSCLLFDLAIEPLSAMIRKSELRGFDIPGTVEAVKATLFADDTTVYLTEDDDFNTLQAILDVWCSAAKARFNIKKTEIIPIGEKTYRDTVTATYKSTGRWKNFPANVRIASQGEPVRVLGAFIGNGVEQSMVWTPTLNKITGVLERWQRGISTIEGRRHVVQMFIGGMTQFLTDVQCMPQQVCKRLERILRGYLWNERVQPPVSMEQVCASIERGGLGILDLDARNDAIDIMWLKAYLDYSGNRPLWAYIADDIFARTVTLDCTAKDETVRVSPLLQQWRPKVLALPRPLQALIQVAEKYNLRVEGLAFSRSILRGMPMWYHIHADRKDMSKLTRASNVVRCLRDKHELSTVGDFEVFANNFHAPGHLPKLTCRCTGCAMARREDGCDKPYLCAERAKSLLDSLPSKWDPRGVHPCDYEEAIYQSHLELAASHGDGLAPFDRRITTTGHLGETFRIFTTGSVSNVRLNTDELEGRDEPLIVATDGSCLKNGQTDASAGAGVYFGENDPRNVSARLPGTLRQTNQTGEAVATLLATRIAPGDVPLIQETDSETVMKLVTKWRKKHEDAGYVLQKNSLETRTLVAALRSRKAATLFRWVKGHNGHAGNEMADQLAGEGARKAIADDIDMAVPPEWQVSGCKLSEITQKIAYHAIRQRKMVSLKKRQRTEAHMTEILEGVKRSFGVSVSAETIWKALRSKHISRECRQFLWMSIHDGYMVGDKWLRPKMSDELRARAPCARCGVLETMQHILFECNAIGCATVWELLEETWELTGLSWAEPSWGFLGAGCATFPSDTGEDRPSAVALWTILVSESLYFIWKMRCERVIRNEGKEFTQREVTRRWYATIERRLELDRRSCAKYLGRSALSATSIAQIWGPIVHSSGELPPDWVIKSEGLVGIRRGR